MQRSLEVDDLVDVDVVEIALVDRVQRQRHFGYRQRAEYCFCFISSSDALATLELLAGLRIEIGRELRERRQLAVLGQREAYTAAELLDDLGLRGTAHTRYRQTRVDSGRIPALNRSVSRKIWPSVIEITLVGTNADTSPACVSMIGSAVSDRFGP